MGHTTEQSLKLAGKRVMITGGAGFIGSNLARSLINQGATVTIIDSLIPEYGGNLRNLEGIKDKATLNISDVRDEHAMRYLICGHDILFNLAGQTSHLDSMKEPFSDLAINVTAQLSTLEAVRRFNPELRIVFASTRQIYGKPVYLPVDEKHPTHPVDINGVHKLAGETYHTLYCDVYGVRSTVLRLTNTYGPHMRIKDARQTFLGIWIRNVLEGRPILVFGDGTQRRDFNYVDDVVDALCLAATSDKSIGKIYNLAGAEVATLSELASLVTSMEPGKVERVPFPPDLKNIDIGDYYGDATLISKDLGWHPKVSLQKGLKSTLSFYKENLSHYV